MSTRNLLLFKGQQMSESESIVNIITLCGKVTWSLYLVCRIHLQYCSTSVLLLSVITLLNSMNDCKLERQSITIGHVHYVSLWLLLWVPQLHTLKPTVTMFAIGEVPGSLLNVNIYVPPFYIHNCLCIWIGEQDWYPICQNCKENGCEEIEGSNVESSNQPFRRK